MALITKLQFWKAGTGSIYFTIICFVFSISFVSWFFHYVILIVLPFDRQFSKLKKMFLNTWNNLHASFYVMQSTVTNNYKLK